MNIRNKQTFLAAIGDTNSMITWSGIPYHFLQAGKQVGLLNSGLPLATNGFGWKSLRILWNLLQIGRGQKKGGFQYSTDFLERLWKPYHFVVRGNRVINCFQLYAPSIIADPSVEKWFFIDQTLLQLFDYYAIRSSVGRRIADGAVKREKEGYQRAAGIIVHSRWAALSVIEDYGISESKVFVVQPGANVDPDVYTAWERQVEAVGTKVVSENKRPVRLVFVGKYWKRKGLDRLLDALRRVRENGGRATLKVIGYQHAAVPEPYRNLTGVDWVGFVDKRTAARRFVDLVADCDVGCLLSRAEAGGIALREYHALGLAVLAPDTGGAPEHALSGASILISPEADSTQIAKQISALERSSERLFRLKATAWKQRHSVLWQATAEKINNIMMAMQPEARSGLSVKGI